MSGMGDRQRASRIPDPWSLMSAIFGQAPLCQSWRGIGPTLAKADDKLLVTNLKAVIEPAVTHAISAAGWFSGSN
jgi:hypothetical protein